MNFQFMTLAPAPINGVQPSAAEVLMIICGAGFSLQRTLVRLYGGFQFPDTAG